MLQDRGWRSRIIRAGCFISVPALDTGKGWSEREILPFTKHVSRRLSRKTLLGLRERAVRQILEKKKEKCHSGMKYSRAAEACALLNSHFQCHTRREKERRRGSLNSFVASEGTGIRGGGASRLESAGVVFPGSASAAGTLGFRQRPTREPRRHSHLYFPVLDSFFGGSIVRDGEGGEWGWRMEMGAGMAG